MEITKDIQYVGVNDHQVDLFEGQYVVENGMAYNSYMIMDEKIAVCDTVDCTFYRGMAWKYKRCSGWEKTGLSNRSSYGAGSFRKY